MSRMYIGVKADDPAAVAWAQELARQRGWIDVRVESWLYVSGEAPPPLVAWPAPPFKVKNTVAGVMIYMADRVTPWPARPDGIPLDYPPMTVSLKVAFADGEWFQVNPASPELWTRADPAKLSIIL